MQHLSARASRLGKEATWIVLGQVATVLGGLLLVRLLTDFFDPDTYGKIALGLTLCALLHEVLMSAVKSAVERFYHIANQEDDLSSFAIASGNFIGIGLITITLLGAALIYFLTIFNMEEYILFAALLIAFAIANGINSICNGLQNAARERAVVAVHTGANAWLKVAFAAFFLSWLGPVPSSVIIAFLLASIAVNVSQFWRIYKLIAPRMKKPEWKRRWSNEMWLYSWPIATWAPFTWAQQASDRWAIQTFGSLEDVGLYAIVFQLGYAPIGMATLMLSSLIAPILFGRAGGASAEAGRESVNKTAWQLTSLALAATLLATFFAYFLHSWLFSILVSEQYRSVSYSLPYIILAGGIFASGQLLSLKILAELRSVDLLYVKIISAIIGVAANFYGAFLYGLAGVVIGQIIFSSAFFLGVVFLSKKRAYRVLP